jgi:hypothetical protein
MSARAVDPRRGREALLRRLKAILQSLGGDWLEP